MEQKRFPIRHGRSQEEYIDLFNRFKRIGFGFLWKRTHGSPEDLEDMFSDAVARFIKIEKERGIPESLEAIFFVYHLRTAAKRYLDNPWRKVNLISGHPGDPFNPIEHFPDERPFDFTPRIVQVLEEAVSIPDFLPEKLREAVHLCCCKGLSYEEAGKLLNVHRVAIHYRMRKANELLKQFFIDRDITPPGYEE